MKRRGVLGFLGGAMVAGPGMAQQALSGGLEGLSLGGGGMVEMAGATASYYTGSTKAEIDGGYDPLEWPKRELADFLGRSAADLARERLETHVGFLDPDIAGMRSIALQAKIRMQRDRAFERNRAQQRGWLERQLQEAIKRMAS